MCVCRPRLGVLLIRPNHLSGPHGANTSGGDLKVLLMSFSQVQMIQ